jgi:hypothetical protein
MDTVSDRRERTRHSVHPLPRWLVDGFANSVLGVHHAEARRERGA